MRCTQCHAALTAEEAAWQTNLCDGCAIAPTDYAGAQASLQRALDAYRATRPANYVPEYHAIVTPDGDALALWAPGPRR